ncbi:MAG: SEC-C metal-binding domain-containing protein [Thermoguttaceae bacterium]|nr:SEC-C metal-binding domain-containing protein [Thermoguttaceae bacterium]MDW8079459.1 preprotein translocase subunit SecA [Thermoguttaceae bacterium]
MRQQIGFFDRVVQVVSDVSARIGDGIVKGLTAVFGSANERYLRRLQPIVEAINAREPRYQAMTDAELREMTDKFRMRLRAGETLDDLLIDAFAVCREVARRRVGMRHFDVQLMGGIVLHRGGIAEMVTGEGKTLVATLPAYLNALEGKGVHIVTVNDYLARRDMEWMGPIYLGLGLTVGAIQAHMDHRARQKAYDCDITYGTNNEFGFDYLRDNMRPARRGDPEWPPELQQVQRGLHYAIIDEVDNILIDEARTPLIISGPARDNVDEYRIADMVARQLKRGVHFEVNEKERTTHLTEEGVRKAEELVGVESFYTGQNMHWPHLIDNALKAHHLYKRDVHYVVKDDEVIIVDEFTGRLMPGRQWSDGLHQAVEAKEGVRIKEETQTLATITIQNFFKLYKKIAGMTGTAMTEANEFWKIYGMEVVAIPTNKPLRRINHPDVVFRTAKEKYKAIVDEIERVHRYDTVWLDSGQMWIGHIVKEDDSTVVFRPRDERDTVNIPRERVKQIERRGRPILVGTTSIEKSELLSRMLEARGIPHQVLNAKHHEREAEIIAQAGRKGAVTISTNMAGRGTDIILGGNPESMAWALLQHKYPSRLDVPQEEWNALVREIEEREQMKAEGREVAAMGGLYVIGTERHEARRIDLQLRGRAGRQGDPGSSRFFLSLEDDLLRIFGGEWINKVWQWLGAEEGQALESPMLTRRIEGAQKKVEERNFEIRKNLLEYDQVMDQQRRRVYSYRQRILEGADCRELIFEMIGNEVRRAVRKFLSQDYGPACFADFVSRRLGVEFEAKVFRGMDFETAENYARDIASRRVEGQVLELMEEHLPEEEDPSEWNVSAFIHTVNSRWNTGIRDRDIKRLSRDELSELLVEKARQFVEGVDLQEGAVFLQPGYGVQALTHWVATKFGAQISPSDIKEGDPEAVEAFLLEAIGQLYEHREEQFPILSALRQCSVMGPGKRPRVDWDRFLGWAEIRYGLTAQSLRGLPQEEVLSRLTEASRQELERGRQLGQQLHIRLQELYGPTAGPEDHLQLAQLNSHLDSFNRWLQENVGVELTAEEVATRQRREIEQKLFNALDERVRPEMRRMERALLLRILDEAWKNHLLVMDHLRASVGLRGYAQVDPKVEYKREGMRAFEAMWESVESKVSELIFRVEYYPDAFTSRIWARQQLSRPEVVPLPSSAAREPVAASAASVAAGTSAGPIEPYRAKEKRVGRNDPCPCGSGKKYKRCCGRD